jgi:hypothetical protein
VVVAVSALFRACSTPVFEGLAVADLPAETTCVFQVASAPHTLPAQAVESLLDVVAVLWVVVVVAVVVVLAAFFPPQALNPAIATTINSMRPDVTANGFRFVGTPT